MGTILFAMGTYLSFLPFPMLTLTICLSKSKSLSSNFKSSPIRKPDEYNKAIQTRCFKFFVTCIKRITSSLDNTLGNFLSFLGAILLKSNSKLALVYIKKCFKALINCLCVLIDGFFFIKSASIYCSISLTFSIVSFWWESIVSWRMDRSV